MSHDIPVKEVSELLDTVSTKVPDLIRNLLRTVYSQEAGAEMGKAIGSLYKELITAGLPQEVALKMATDYMFSLKDLMKSLHLGGDKVGHYSQAHGEEKKE